MKILAFADSHGYSMGMAYAVEREKPDAVLHLGDHTDDAHDLGRAFPGLAIISVRGNNDYGADEPLFCVTVLGGVRIYLTHGHREHVYSTCDLVAQRAREEGCSLAFFGHTHRVQVERKNGVLVCNPGSISLPRGGPASYGRLTVENGQAQRLEILDEDGGLLRRDKLLGR
ncbi:metallophosphoesterase [Agathobaculum sp.]|uniref:metallophosphoesterase n=1 Tax=Agathobaculum sp. TaxID=2048138 RepID=UPI0027B94BBF|nr:metallophosphoesterase [Agathobaculum sp.]